MTRFANVNVAAIITVSLITCCATRVASAAYVDEVLADNPICYWRLDEQSGTDARNVGSSGMDGTYVNVTLGEPGLIASEPDNTAVRFDGHSSMVETPLLQTGVGKEVPYAEDRSVVLWFKADDVDRTVTTYGFWNEQILYEEGSDSTAMNVYINDGQVYVGDSNNYLREWRVHLGTPISSGEVYQVALVRDWDPDLRDGTLTGYLNGQPFAQQSGIKRLSLWPVAFWSPTRTGVAVGAMWNGTNTAALRAPGDGLYFEGVIGDVALYDTALSAERILAQYMAGVGDAQAVLQAGDANMDYEFDQLDLVKVQVAAKYLTGQPATWGEGDWNGAPGGSPGAPPSGNGLFDQFDIIAAQQAAVYLIGPYAAVAPGGTRGDGQTSVVYDVRTGELAVDAPAGTELTSINIDSAAGIFTGQPAQNLGGSFDNDADDNIFKATFGNSFGSLSFGNVAQSSLSEDFVLNDLTVVGSLAGGGDLGDVDLIYVPEPATVVLCVFGLLGVLLGRQRRRM